jgi:hypothetical protein
MGQETISVEKLVNTTPDKIFDILSRPSRHPEIDGSNSVIKVNSSAPEPLKLGDKFNMSMKLGLPYFMINTIVEYDENKKIAWQPKAPGIFGKFAGGRIWRYELEPSGDNNTIVKETWDITQEANPLAKKMLLKGPAQKKVVQAIEKTLENLANLFE